MHVVDVMNAANSVRCLLELSADELEETCDMCREHGERSTRWGRLDRSSIARLAHPGLYKIEHFGKRSRTTVGPSQFAHLGSSAQKTEVFNIVQTPAGVGSSVRLAAAVSARESCG